MKTRLILIGIMFVIINVIFYFGFDSSEESEESAEFDDQNQMNVENDEGFDQGISISPNPNP